MTEGDAVRVSVVVAVAPSIAFEIFTEEIDRWWRRGLKHRLGRDRSVLHLEPRLGGGLFETFTSPSGKEHVRRTGTVTVWDPPRRLALDWRAANFSDDEVTQVEVTFAPSATGTRVTLVHAGWSKIRLDHPARHDKPVPLFVAELGQWWAGLLTSLREHTLVRS